MELNVPLSQLSVLPVDGKLFVMDRHRARWLFLQGSDIAAFRLLGRSESDLSEPDRDQRARMIDRLHAAQFGVDIAQQTALTTLILKLTKVCNYRCKYCYDMEPEDTALHLSQPVALKAIEDAIEIAARPESVRSGADLTVILHGGEPTLMFPLIKKLVIEGKEMARRRGKTVRFCGQTNLSRVDEAFVDFANEHQVGWGVSLDGPAPMNDRLRVLPSGDGTYSYFARALERFPEFVRRSSVMSVITSMNQSHLLSIARHFRDCGMAGWDWTLFQAIGQARASDGLRFSTDRLIDSWNDLFDAVEGGEFDGFEVRPVKSYLDNLVMGPGGNMCMRQHCGAARDLMSVSYDGTIEACDCIDRKGPLANLGLIQIQSKNSLEAARQSEKADLIRSRNVELGKCQSCMWLSVCGGTCLAYSPSIHDVYEPHCRIAMNAFSRIVNSLSKSDALYRYWNSAEQARAEKREASSARAGSTLH
jgi:uncharacterized protein